MRRSTLIVFSLLLAVAAAVLVAGVWYRGRPRLPWAAEIVRLGGEARWSTNGGSEWFLAGTGARLPEGVIIQTRQGAENLVDLRLGDAAADAGHEVIRLHGDTAVAIETRRSHAVKDGRLTSTSLDLRHGHLSGRGTRLAIGSRFEVRYQGGVVALRPPDFFFDLRRANPLTGGGTNPPCELRLLSGSAVVLVQSSGQPVIAMVPAGSRFEDRTGAAAPLTEADRQELGKTAAAVP